MKFFSVVVRSFILGAVVTCLNSNAFATQAKEEALWLGLKEGEYVALIRHARAPGNGDPADFELRDCATQRNLSNDGRDQARRIGLLIKQAGLTLVDVYSSQWCRCLETARLLGLGDVGEISAFNSFYQRQERKVDQIKEMRRWLSERDASRSSVIVTHQVNISGVADIFPASGEVVFVSIDRSDKVQLVGTIVVE